MICYYLNVHFQGQRVKLPDIFIYLINNGDIIDILTCCVLNVTFYVNIDNVVDCVQRTVGVVVCI